MILRKPYAFLIRKFRLIHLLLFLLLVYICYSTNNLYLYFSKCISNRSIAGETSSVGIGLFLLILLAIGLFSIILVLMNRKKKPSKYYLISILSYSVLIIVLLFVNSQMYNLLIEDTDVRVLAIARDLLLIVYMMQYIFAIMALVRALGFNIKKFDFQNDLKELSILSEDNEEFELDVELNIDDVKTKMRRNLRIAKYVLRENKFLVTVVVSGLSIYLVSSFLLDKLVYNRIYRENQTYKVNTMSVTVLSSYETHLNYERKDVSKAKYKYNVVKVRIKNNGDENKILNTSGVTLKTDKYKSYYIDTNSNKYFIDMGIGYKKQAIKPKETREFLFVFLIPNEESKETLFQMLISVTTKDGQPKYNYAKVKLNLRDTADPSVEDTKKLTETLNLNESLMGDTTLKIDEVTYDSFQVYEYKKTINNKEYSFLGIIHPNLEDYYDKFVAKLKMNISFDKDITNEKITTNFFENFGEIRYVIDGKTYTYRNITEFTSNDPQYRYIDIPKAAINSENIYLDLVIRDLKYTYILK